MFSEPRERKGLDQEAVFIYKALFSSQQILQKFSNFPSHGILDTCMEY